MSHCGFEDWVNCVVWISCAVIFFLSPDVCVSTQTAALWASEHAGIKTLCDWVPFHLVLGSGSPTVQHNMPTTALLGSALLQKPSQSLRTVELGAYSSVTRPEKLCIYHMNSFTVNALNLRRRWLRIKFTNLDSQSWHRQWQKLHIFCWLFPFSFCCGVNWILNVYVVNQTKSFFVLLWNLAERCLPPSTQQLISVMEFHKVC